MEIFEERSGESSREKVCVFMIHPLLSAKAGNRKTNSMIMRWPPAGMTPTTTCWQFRKSRVHSLRFVFLQDSIPGIAVKRRYHYALPERSPRRRLQRSIQVRKAGMKRRSQLGLLLKLHSHSAVIAPVTTLGPADKINRRQEATSESPRQSVAHSRRWRVKLRLLLLFRLHAQHIGRDG